MSSCTLRSATADDGDFLYRVAEVNFRPLVEGAGKKWAAAPMREKCRLDALSPATAVVQVAGKDIGFVKVDVEESAVVIDALLLLPEFQRRGVGARIFRDIESQARSAGLPMRLSVYAENPARAFWEKHGFTTTGQSNHHLQMERQP